MLQDPCKGLVWTFFKITAWSADTHVLLNVNTLVLPAGGLFQNWGMPQTQSVKIQTRTNMINHHGMDMLDVFRQTHIPHFRCRMQNTIYDLSTTYSRYLVHFLSKCCLAYCIWNTCVWPARTALCFWCNDRLFSSWCTRFWPCFRPNRGGNVFDFFFAESESCM